MSGRDHTHLFEMQTPDGPDVALTPEAHRHFAAVIAEQARVIQEQTAYIARYKKMYDRSSALAKIGVWECDLATETLTWTDGVYDIFELPRGSDVTRALTLDLYDEASRLAMSALRQKAIEDCGSFQLDIRIQTAKGNDRWVRLSADIECEDGRALRIFGLKQDITQEKEAIDRLRVLAESDALTGLANRSVFETMLEERLKDGQHSLALAALILIDLDGFKQINDTFGHAAGDACLKEVAARISRTCRRNDLVARIGGDEFAILMSGLRDRVEIQARIAEVLAEVRQPTIWHTHALTLGACFGIAIPRIEHQSAPAQLCNEADVALYAAKKEGPNSIRTFDPQAVSDAGLGRIVVEEATPAFA